MKYLNEFKLILAFDYNRTFNLHSKIIGNIEVFKTDVLLKQNLFSVKKKILKFR